MKFDSPSGAFKATIRKAKWGDAKLRSPYAGSEIVHRPNGDGVIKRTVAASDLTEIEIRAVTVEVLVKVALGEDVVEYRPLEVERDPQGRYHERAFSDWLGDQDPEDVIALHAEVLNLNPLWKELI